MTAPVRKVPEYCYQCVAGPDLLTVKVEDGVATEVEPNFAARRGASRRRASAASRPTAWCRRPTTRTACMQPMKRTNPKKGRDQDPGFVPISWDEALRHRRARS